MFSLLLGASEAVFLNLWVVVQFSSGPRS